MEDTSSKKEASYTYWVQNNHDQYPQSKDATIIAPKKLECPNLIKELSSQSGQNGQSAWNAAGTWYD